MKAEQERLRSLLTDTVTLLCRNGLQYSTELRVQGLLGITLDDKDVFLVQFNEKLGNLVSSKLLNEDPGSVSIQEADSLKESKTFPKNASQGRKRQFPQVSDDFSVEFDETVVKKEKLEDAIVIEEEEGGLEHVEGVPEYSQCYQDAGSHTAATSSRDLTAFNDPDLQHVESVMNIRPMNTQRTTRQPSGEETVLSENSESSTLPDMPSASIMLSDPARASYTDTSSLQLPGQDNSMNSGPIPGQGVGISYML